MPPGAIYRGDYVEPSSSMTTLAGLPAYRSAPSSSICNVGNSRRSARRFLHHRHEDYVTSARHLLHLHEHVSRTAGVQPGVISISAPTYAGRPKCSWAPLYHRDGARDVIFPTTTPTYRCRSRRHGRAGAARHFLHQLHEDDVATTGAQPGVIFISATASAELPACSPTSTTPPRRRRRSN